MAFWVRLKRTVADALFSDYIREKANWSCERCFRQFTPPTRELQCSHYFSRAKRSVRFDFENAAALCGKCHFYLGSPENRKEHEEFFIRKLGREKYDLLCLRASLAANSMDVNENNMRDFLRVKLNELRNSKPVIYVQKIKEDEKKNDR